MEGTPTLENPWMVLAKSKGKYIGRHTFHGEKARSVRHIDTSLSQNSNHSTASAASFASNDETSSETHENEKNGEAPVNRWKIMAKAQLERRKNLARTKPSSPITTKQSNNNKSSQGGQDQKVLASKSVEIKQEENIDTTIKPTTNALISSEAIVNNPWKAMAKKKVKKDNVAALEEPVGKTSAKPSVSLERTKLSGVYEKNKSLSSSNNSDSKNSAVNICRRSEVDNVEVGNDIVTAKSDESIGKKPIDEKVNKRTSSSDERVTSEAKMKSWKAKASMRKSAPVNLVSIREKAKLLSVGMSKANTEKSNAKRYSDVAIGSSASNKSREEEDSWIQQDETNSSALPSVPFCIRRRTPSASKSSDDLLPVTAHAELHGGPVRPSLVRVNSTACIVSPTHKKKSIVIAPTAKGVSKVRKTVKALEFSHMLNDEDMVKLLYGCHDEIKGDLDKQAEFGNSKGVPALVKVLNKYEGNAEILEACFLLIADLAKVETNRDALALNGCIEIVLMAMLQLEHDLLLQEYGCYAIASLAGARKYQEWIVQCNGIEVIKTTQQAFTSNIKIQTSCLVALRSLARDNTENCFSIVAKGAIRSILIVVKDEQNRREICLQKEACATIVTLAGTIDSNRSSIAKAGGIETTLWALTTFPDECDLQCLGLEALGALIIGHSHNADCIVGWGGISLLIQTLRVYENNVDVAMAGFRFAKTLTAFDHISHVFSSEGGLKVILPIMRTFEGNDAIQEEGCSILCNIALHNESKGLICSSGGVKMIAMAMKRLHDNSTVQKNGIKALDSLATNEENKRMIASGGGISAVLGAMKEHSDNPALQGLATGALRKLASVSRNQKVINENEGVHVIEAAMAANENHNYLQQNGKKLLALLDPSRYSTDDT
jgi:hypothetical protein